MLKRKQKTKFIKRHADYLGIPHQSVYIILGMLIISLLLHLVGFFEISGYVSERGLNRKKFREQPKIQVKLTDNKKDTKKSEANKILEVKQRPTEKPENARYKGAQDHKTFKETKIKSSPNRSKALDPGMAGTGLKRSTKKRLVVGDKISEKKLLKPKVGVSPRSNNTYEKLMPAFSDLVDELKAGYQDHIEDDIEIGDRIDLNTTDYRFIGYFTSFRKAFELVWTYPSQAVRRGLQGVVGLEFTLKKDGSVRGVKIISSSGYAILDNAAVRALREAAPYSPIPDGIEKDELLITGNFRYVLSGSG